MLLADLPGLAGARHLVSRLAASSDAAAVLLYGAAGAHQDDVAHTLASLWLCDGPTENGPCGQCASCGARQRGVHVDLLHVRPTGAGNQIRVFLITEAVDPPPNEPPFTPVSRFVGTPPLMARHKVVLITDAHRMNDRAANSLLKTLEEPAPFVRFVLATSEIGQVMATIRSRCLGVACELPDRTEASLAYGDAAELFLLAPHAAARLQTKPDAFAGLTSIVDGLASAPVGAGLKLAESLKELSGQLDGDASEREGLLATLELFAMLVSRRYPERPDWSRAILAAHRQVGGNVNSRGVLDALFIKLLLTR